MPLDPIRADIWSKHTETEILRQRGSKGTICDFKFSNSRDVSWNMNSLGNPDKLDKPTELKIGGQRAAELEDRGQKGRGQPKTHSAKGIAQNARAKRNRGSGEAGCGDRNSSATFSLFSGLSCLSGFSGLERCRTSQMSAIRDQRSDHL